MSDPLPPAAPTPAEIYLGLRAQVFALDPHQAGLESTRTAHPWLWGVAMETGYANGIASLVCLADGATSLYLSAGGGTVGAGAYPAVAAAAHALLTTAESALGSFPLSDADHVPKVGHVRLTLFGWQDSRAAEDEEDVIAAKGHPLCAVFHAGHSVVTQLRLIT